MRSAPTQDSSQESYRDEESWPKTTIEMEIMLYQCFETGLFLNDQSPPDSRKGMFREGFNVIWYNVDIRTAGQTTDQPLRTRCLASSYIRS